MTGRQKYIDRVRVSSLVGRSRELCPTHAGKFPYDPVPYDPVPDDPVPYVPVPDDPVPKYPGHTTLTYIKPDHSTKVVEIFEIDTKPTKP